jgi:hypothetical protein
MEKGDAVSNLTERNSNMGLGYGYDLVGILKGPLAAYRHGAA